MSKKRFECERSTGVCSSDLLVGAGKRNLHVRADGEAHVAFAVFVDHVTQQADLVRTELALGADAHRPDFVTGIGDMVQHARTRAVVVFPVAVVLDHQRMHVLKAVGAPGLDGGAGSRGFFSGCLGHNLFSPKTCSLSMSGLRMGPPEYLRRT